MTARIAVLASGNGSNLQAIIDACAEARLDAEVAAVISDRPQSFGLQRAVAADIAAVALPARTGEIRADYDIRLAEVVASHRPDLVVLAGWMRVLSNSFLQNCAAPVINLHPARPGEFPGVKAIERAFAERDSHNRSDTGVMVHYVLNEGVDDGPVIATTDVNILANDSVETLTERVHVAEHEILIEALKIALAAISTLES